MIYKYQINIKKDSNCLHGSLKLSDGKYIVKNEGHNEDGTWNLNIYQKLIHFNGNKRELERKLPGSHIIDERTNIDECHKKIRSNSMSSQNLIGQSPIVLTWDAKNYNCTYDSLFTVLYHIWNEGQLKHRNYFENGTQLIQILHSKFSSLFNENCTFKSVRDHSRSIFAHKKPLQYHYGRKYADINELVRYFTSTKSYGTSCLHCAHCEYSIKKQCVYLGDCTVIEWSRSDKDDLQQIACVQRYLNYKLVKNDESTKNISPICRNVAKKDFPLYNTQYIDELPLILMFALAP
jgi:hypothetical protein